MDFCKLNGSTVPDHYPVLHIHNFPLGLRRSCIFSKIDLVKAYFQIPVVEEEIPKTAVTTPFGLYEFVQMPFGLRNAAQTFQRLIDQVLKGLTFVYVYIDNILIASHSTAEHKYHLQHVFQRLSQFGLKINLDKCIFGTTQVKFLELMINQHGISPLPGKVEAIENFLVPTSIRQLQRFIGLINYYCHFTPNLSTILLPLTNLLEKNTRKLLYNRIHFMPSIQLNQNLQNLLNSHISAMTKMHSSS